MKSQCQQHSVYRFRRRLLTKDDNIALTIEAQQPLCLWAFLQLKDGSDKSRSCKYSGGDERVQEMIMVSYAPNRYRLWDMQVQKVRIARDVKFDEITFP